MKDYNWIKRTLQEHLEDDMWSQGDPAVHAGWIHDALDNGTNENINISYEDIAAVAMTCGYDVIRVNRGYYDEPDYLIMKKGYTLDKYKKHWEYELGDEVYEMLEGARKLLSLEDIYKQD